MNAAKEKCMQAWRRFFYHIRQFSGLVDGHGVVGSQRGHLRQDGHEGDLAFASRTLDGLDHLSDHLDVVLVQGRRHLADHLDLSGREVGAHLLGHVGHQPDLLRGQLSVDL